MIYVVQVPCVVHASRLFWWTQVTRFGRRLLDSPHQNYLISDHVSYALHSDDRAAILVYVPAAMTRASADEAEQPYYGLQVRICYKLQEAIMNHATLGRRLWARIHGVAI
ncbi:MAG TPA: hypothetical protein VLG92_01810 [Candidatus Saccharimonadia bacterium]|nr:hypothetical protein [Candidatus Saccharimonadia bacterium]